MSTFGRMISRVSRELRRDGLTADIKAGIQSAIEFYAPERFWFNEGEATAHVTTGAISIAYPTNFRDIDTVEISSTATDRFELLSDSIESIRAVNSSPSFDGIPDSYATFRERLYFAPRPDHGYEVKVFGHLDLTTVSASASNGATNAWMTHGEELIRAKAKSYVAEDRLRNYELADRMLVKAERAKRKLQDTTVDKLSSGRVARTRF